MKLILASLVVLVLIASLSILGNHLLNPTFSASLDKKRQEDAIVIYDGYKTINDNTACIETRDALKELFNSQQMCSTNNDCELVYSFCSYVAFNKKNHTTFKSLRSKEDNVCSDKIIPQCLQSEMKEALCISNTCQTVTKLDLKNRIRTTTNEIKKPQIE